jgi:hypothetical protein
MQPQATQSSARPSIYAPERTVDNINDCIFYHAMELPGYGLKIQAEGYGWDLRDCADKYVGIPNLNYKNKRVLELGTANGFLCNFLEKQGAEVVAYDLHPGLEWDIVPYAQYDHKANIKNQQNAVRQINNAWWFAKGLLNWKAKVVYGSVYEIPMEIGQVDISTFGSILLHLRDPFRALHRASLLTKEAMVVTDMLPDRPLSFNPSILRRAKRWVRKNILKQEIELGRDVPYMEFLPNFRLVNHREAWWSLPPRVIQEFLGVLGFEDSKVTYFEVNIAGSKAKSRYYNIVAKRTRPIHG